MPDQPGLGNDFADGLGASLLRRSAARISGTVGRLLVQ